MDAYHEGSGPAGGRDATPRGNDREAGWGATVNATHRSKKLDKLPRVGGKEENKKAQRKELEEKNGGKELDVFVSRGLDGRAVAS